MDNLENTPCTEQEIDISNAEEQITQTAIKTNKIKSIIIISIIAILTITATIIGIRFYSNYLNDKKAADNVISLINSITSSDDEFAWAEPRKAYDALTDKQKNMVSNLSILENAEEEYKHSQDLLLVGADISLLYTYMFTATNSYLNGDSSYILLMNEALEVSNKLHDRDIPDELKDVYELCKDTYINFSFMMTIQTEARQDYATKFAQNMLLLKEEVNKINNLEHLENK